MAERPGRRHGVGAVLGGVGGAAAGGAAGFLVRGWLNEAEAIGFGNIPDQLLKLAAWAVAGAVVGAVAGTLIGRVVDRR